ncbi:LPPG domain protein containing protein [Methanolacinia petrolearia DSM 11571]|uniref:2-phospho-L-lactate transferase n=1 Tax=Methanolacinia petrolearia (strain DSM 11571 / OCM 486 / SEBR 4847) TaxID=679926 RepID=E1RIP7_METP4|nr:2-phospho-L-lactate transferase [Methanolacinia petrolearia]ADN36639.1 LPPG domain protein containing protein [Methanolacinia petrolearia DSM 11571]
MKVAFLSGGTGTPKLIRGFRNHLSDNDISVIVNTAEDMWIYGSHLSPDIDTVMYLFAGILNTDSWWGIKGDTTITNDTLKDLGEDVYLTLGDRDRALNIARARMLNSGITLTGATRELCKRLGISANILPMTDSEYTTYIKTGDLLIHFQEYWVKHRGNLDIEEVVRVGDDQVFGTKETIDAINNADLVVIGPSNPVTSISPILECSGVKDALKESFVVAVSPFIGNEPVSGPAKALMEAWGMTADSAGTYKLYNEFTDLFIQDIRDTITLKDGIKLDTLMKTEDVSSKLAGEIISRVC